MPQKIQNPVRSMFEVEGASIRVSDLRGKAYETITLNADYTVTETMAEGYVPNAMMDEHVDLFCARLRVFARKHSPYTPDPAALVALFIRGNMIARNPARRIIEAPVKKRR